MHLAYQDECGLSLQESQKMKQFLIETTLLLYNAVVGRSKPNLGVTKYNINNYKAHCQTFVFFVCGSNFIFNKGNKRTYKYTTA